MREIEQLTKAPHELFKALLYKLENGEQLTEAQIVMFEYLKKKFLSEII